MSKEEKKKIYYNGDELLSRHFNINMICGDRFGGKTTFAQKYVIKRAIRGKGQDQFAVIVRYAKDIKILCDTYFDNTMAEFYPDYEIEYSKKKFWLKKKSETDKKKKILVGYGFALNEATKMKSTSYPLINTLIMEEFLNIENKYIKSQANPELEVELLISLFSTIARGKGKQYRDNVRVLLISNNYYLNNPYFRYYNLIERIAYAKNPFQRFFIKNTKPECIVEICHNDIQLRIGRDDINKGNKFIDLQNELRIVKNPKVNKVLFQMSFDNKNFISTTPYNDGVLIFDSGKKIRPECEVFSCSEIKKKYCYNLDVLKKGAYREIWERLVKLFNMNKLYYDKISTFITLKNIIEFSPNK